VIYPEISAYWLNQRLLVKSALTGYQYQQQFVSIKIVS